MTPPHNSPGTSLLAFLILCLVLSIGLSEPVGARSFFFTAETGYSIQSGPDGFKREWNNGYIGALGAIFDAGSGIGLVGRIEYHHFPMDKSAASYEWGAVRALMISLSTRIAFMDEDDPYRPYVVLGYGTADLSLSTDDAGRPLTEYDGSDLRQFFQIGVGADINLQMPVRLIIEARWVTIRARFGAEATSFFPLTVGARF